MRDLLIVMPCAVVLTMGMMFLRADDVYAANEDTQIETLKKKLEDIEKKRDAELEMLKERIHMLEEDRKVRSADVASAPPADVEELRIALNDVQQKVDAQNSALTRFDKIWGDRNFKVGFRTQGWYQFVEDGVDSGDDNLNDFMVRRAYLYLKGDVTEKMGFFSHIAADRIGQDSLSNSGMGLGTGIAVRDAWIYYNHSDAFKVQLGRMYVPFTRNYGTTSTFAMMPLELTFAQGGVRGGILYASKVGRDDGIVFWGNPLDGKIQYRLGILEGVEGSGNEDDNLRFTGRISLNLLEPETSWYNKGTYLGEKKVLALGFGFDYQDDLQLGGVDDQRNLGWTADLFYDHPLGDGAVTVEAAYIRMRNVTQTLSFSRLDAGENAQFYYIQGGYLLPGTYRCGRFQPYFRWERVAVDDDPDTLIPSVGLNYFLKGHSAKLTLDWTFVDQRGSSSTFTPNSTFTGEDQHIVTLQASLGF